MPAERLDKVLAQYLPEHSRARLQRWITEGHVQVNDQVVNSVKHKVGAGDQLLILPQPSPEHLAFTPEHIDFDVVVDSPDWIIVNKPAGLVTHPGAGNWSGTLLNGLLYRYPELAQLPRAGIVHRLDKDTSGLMVIARHEVAQTHLVRQLQDRSMKRQYLALVQGHTPRQGTVDAPIGRDAKVPVRMSIDLPIAPKPAITHFQRLGLGEVTLKQGRAPVSAVHCQLETGRTHQIRVHLASLGHSLMGDSLYGAKVLAPRQQLHAFRLAFCDLHQARWRQFEAPLPSDMQAQWVQIHWQEGGQVPITLTQACEVAHAE